LQSTSGADKRLNAYVAGLEQRLRNGGDHGPLQEFAARELTEKLALALQASLLVRYGSPALAKAFIASRLDGQHGNAFGTLPAGINIIPILDAVAESIRLR
jgi:putative acyl-CoA dehydrogenase